MSDKLRIIYRPIAEITPYDNNPRRNEDAVRYVANSIREFGFKVPIVIDGDGTIVAGHTRYLACFELGITDVPCIIADDLTEEQIRAYRLADNKVAEIAEWDYERLAEELEGILNIDMEDFGFSEVEEIDFSNLESMMGEADQDYLDFVDKFKQKHKPTTDDCFTPAEVYEAVSDWVMENYGDDWTKIVRPFYPGGGLQDGQVSEGMPGLG